MLEEHQHLLHQHRLYQELEWLDQVELGINNNSFGATASPNLQSCLKPNQALLDYALLGSDLFLFVVRLNDQNQLDVSFYYLNAKADTIIARAVMHLRQSIAAQARIHEPNADANADAVPHANKIKIAPEVNPEQYRFLFEVLIKPALPKLQNITHLIISPDSTLGLMPFGMLKNADGENSIRLFSSIRYIPTPRDLIRLEYVTHQEFTSQKAELFGHNFAPVNPQIPIDPSTQNNFAVAVKAAQFSFAVSELKLTEMELRTVKQALQNKSFLVRTSFNQDFSAERLKAVQHPSVLHLSTHGAFIRELPKNSTLPLEIQAKLAHPMDRVLLLTDGAQYPNWLENNTGFISARDILSMDLRQSIVVLSACQTSEADTIGAGGMTSLMQAFILADAKTVITTLWNVYEEPTLELLKVFYENLRDGKNTVEALQSAQGTIWVNVTWQDPVYWAGFQHYGKPSTLVQARDD